MGHGNIKTWLAWTTSSFSSKLFLDPDKVVHKCTCRPAKWLFSAQTQLPVSVISHLNWIIQPDKKSEKQVKQLPCSHSASEWLSFYLMAIKQPLKIEEIQRAEKKNNVNVWKYKRALFKNSNNLCSSSEELIISSISSLFFHI